MSATGAGRIRRLLDREIAEVIADERHRVAIQPRHHDMSQLPRRYFPELVIQELHVYLWCHHVIASLRALRGDHQAFRASVGVMYDSPELCLDRPPIVIEHLVAPAHDTSQRDV